MGNIVLQEALRISTTVLSRVANPGDTIIFPFTVSNIGDEPEEIQFSVVASIGWDTRVLAQNGESLKVLLEPNSLNLDLEVTAPSAFMETATILITAMGTKNATLEFTVIPKTSISKEIELKTTYLSVSEEIGKTIYLPLSVTNKGEIDETVNLMGSIPNGWELSFVTGTQMAVQTLYLNPGQSESITIKVVPSYDAVA